MNFPSGVDVAKNGCGRTPTCACIQPCTLHWRGTITSAVLNVRVVVIPALGWLMLKPRFAAGTALMLCSSGSLFLISIFCPTCTPKTRGWYSHPCWSIVTACAGVG